MDRASESPEAVERALRESYGFWLTPMTGRRSASSMTSSSMPRVVSRDSTYAVVVRDRRWTIDLADVVSVSTPWKRVIVSAAAVRPERTTDPQLW